MTTWWTLILSLLLVWGGQDRTQPEADQTEAYELVAKANCGAAGKEIFLQAGQPYRYPEKDVPFERVGREDPARSVVFGDPLRFAFQGLIPEAGYRLKVTYLSDSDTRVQRLTASGKVLRERFALPEDQTLVQELVLPRETYATGRLELEVARIEGPNAVVSVIELWSTEQGLRWFHVRTAGDLKGNLNGTVQDAMGNTLAGTALKIFKKGFDLQPETVSDASGAFRLTLPTSWGSRGGTFTLQAQQGEVVMAKELAVDRFILDPPRLTPSPVSMQGMDHTVLDLTGTWRFHPSPAEAFFRLPLQEGEGWSDIQVPGEWVMQGLEVKPDGAAGYLRGFHLPEAWKDQRIKLRFDGVYSKTVVWVNGKEAGGHEGGFTPFELDITALARTGEENLLALAVTNESLADRLASATFYAAHPLGGITRKLYCFAVPEVHLASLHVATTFDEGYRDAKLKVLLDLANEGPDTVEGAVLLLALTGPDGKPVAIESDRSALPALPPRRIVQHVLSIPVPAPLKWDPEHPNLYRLSCGVERAACRTVTVEQPFGFRQVEVRGNRLFVNNHPVKLRGVNRHEAHPLRGRSLTPELWRKDAELYRDGNVNYIRTSHYPPAEEFLQACDEVGLFVEEEAPHCWVGRDYGGVLEEGVDEGHLKYQPDIVRPALAMVERDKSHPCVIYWSLANESHWGPNFDRAADLVGEKDPTRPRKFNYAERHQSPNRGNCEIGSFHYPGPDGIETYRDHFRPVVFDEYCHLNTYNRTEIAADPGVRDAYGRALSPMWDQIYGIPACLGGAIWSGIDDVFHLPSGRKTGYGEWGPLDGWRRLKPEYWHMKKAYSPIRIRERVLALPAAGEPLRVKVDNRHDFTDLDEVQIAWTLGEQRGTVAAKAAPHSTGEIRIAIEKPVPEGSVLSLEFLSHRGFLIDAYRLTVGDVKASVDPAEGATMTDGEMMEGKTLEGEGLDETAGDPGNFTVTQSEKTYQIHAGDCTWTFDRPTGRLREAMVGSRTVLTGGPRLMVLPLESGPCKPDFSGDLLPLNRVCSDWEAGTFAVRSDRTWIEVQVAGQYKSWEGSYTMRFDDGGGLTMNYRFTAMEDVNPRQWGMVFDLPRSLDTLSWKRKAYWSVYPDDHIGRPEGTTKAFRDGKWPESDLFTPPTWPWRLDQTSLGTNDFRATRSGILEAVLRAEDRAGVRVLSNGTQSVRAFMEGDAVRLLVAGFNTGGGDIFLASHYQGERKPLKKGDTLSDTLRLELIKE